MSWTPTKTHRQTAMMNKRFLLLGFLAATVFAAGLPGGWKPIENLKDPHVTEIGQYAVTEYNRRAMKDLKLQKVDQGFSQVVEGTNYRLVLATKDGKGVGEKYEAIVWEKEWLNYRNLTSFAPVKSRN